jgi:hypothetical protein
MRMRTVAWIAFGLIAACLSFGEVHAERRVVPPRPGQVGIGVQGQFGSLLNSGQLGSDFGSGPGVVVRLRYRMRYERALGLAFESQKFDVRDQADSTGALTKTTAILSGIELYQMFGTRTSSHKNLSVGVGLVQISQSTNDGGTLFPGDGLYVSAGAGIEQFFWNSWAWDLSTRYYAIFQEGNTNHDFQMSLGLIFYASY